MANKIRAIFILLIGTLICSTVAGCGFKLRSPNDIPPYLCILYIDSPNPYDLLTIQLSRTLQALNVHLTKTREDAPVILRIININWEPLIPAILYSRTATFYTYLLSVDFDLETVNGQILMGPKNLTLRRRLIQNANQIYTPNATRLMKQEMTRTMVSLIYKDLVTFPHPSPPHRR
ncbi:LPS assembly lipoprotein LptE [Candidatus Coxiella mudrowiae]|uniref:LPS-assembly lipoprotein LptE n=1 Tax=Candidatus Coxiella mudrowiae TaxID=2054173 RepID=UPI000C290472|nr:LPS assembly lipoprotein LptE [Candidatus Coxiella mudrowiae]